MAQLDRTLGRRYGGCRYENIRTHSKKDSNMKQIKTGRFEWNGLYWVALITFEDSKVEVGIEAKDDELDVVKELESIALAFPEFWSKNRKQIVSELQFWLENEFGSKPTAMRCTLECARFDRSVWRVSNFCNKEKKKVRYFNLLVSFEDANGPVLGPSGAIDIVGRFDDRLRMYSELRFEVVSI